MTSDPIPSAQTAVVTPLPPVNMAPPTISGSLTEGQFLTEAHGTWTNDPTSYSYQSGGLQRRWEQLLVDPERHRPEVPAHFD